MPSRTFTVAAAVASTAVLATGITYASTDRSTQAEPAAEQPVHRAAPPARQAAPAPAPVGSESGTEAKGDKGNKGDNEGSDRGGRGDEGGGRGDGGDEGGGRGDRGDEGGGRGDRGDEGGDRGDRGDEGGDRGGRDRGHDRNRKRERIFFNEREYGAYPGGCIPAASGLGSSSFSIYNDSRHAVEVFRGFACDGGSPVATVGPYGSTYGVVTPNVRGGGFIDNGVVGSFRVIGHDEEW